MTEQDTALAARLQAKADLYYEWASLTNVAHVQSTINVLREAAERLRGLTAPFSQTWNERTNRLEPDAPRPQEDALREVHRVVKDCVDFIDRRNVAEWTPDMVRAIRNTLDYCVLAAAPRQDET